MVKRAISIDAQVAARKALPYTRELVRNSDGSWFGRIVELTGCMTEGDTQSEVLVLLDDAMDVWLRVKIADGDAIPDPIVDADFSGKFIVRLPRSLHRELARRAEKEGVSLNAFVTVSLTRCIG